MATYLDKKTKKWFADIQYSINGVTHHHKKRGFELKRDAINYENDFRRNKLESNTNLTLRSVFEDYLKSLTSKAETKQNIRGKIENLLGDFLETKIKSMNPKKILEVVEVIKESKYSKSYKNYTLAHFKSMLKFANFNYEFNTKFELIKKIPKDSSDLKSFETWNDEEFNQFIAHVEHPVYKAFYTLLYKTGLRRGEGLALEYSDLVDNRLNITKSYRRELGTLKNISSHRSILLDNETKEMLVSLIRPQGKYFFGYDRHLSLSQVQRYFDAGIESSGVKRINIHDLRHSHATNLINKGANIVAVSKRLGHSDIKMTIETYTHITEKTEQELISLL